MSAQEGTPAPAIPDKKVGTASKPSPPPTYNVDNRVIFFSFCWKKTRYFSTLVRGDEEYMIQLKCPKYFWPVLWPCSSCYVDVKTFNYFHLHVCVQVYNYCYCYYTHTIMMS